MPVRADGSKAPALDTWDELKRRLPTIAELQEWFSSAGEMGLAVIGGAVSGGLLILDFEFVDFWEAFVEAAQAILGDCIEALPLVRTPGKTESGGRHLYLRTDGQAVSTGKLARLTAEEAQRRTGDKGQQTAIEVKSEGGYVLTPGCPCSCHSSGRLYEHIGGLPIVDVPTLPATDVEALLTLARSLCQQKREKASATISASTASNGERPGDDFNHRAEWADILPAHGWTSLYGKGDTTYWRRPGKERGLSATTGFCRNEKSGELFYVFSTNAAPFEEERAYSKFSTYSLLNHGGDWSAAARALQEAGWGSPSSNGQAHAQTNGAAPQPADGDATAADLVRINATIRWQWASWIPLGVLTILASEPGIGKTRLCADLLRRIYLGMPWPDGAPASLPAGATALWVAADNQHPELGTLPTEFGFPLEALYLNACKSNPFGGTMLDDVEDLKIFEARIKRLRPGLVFVDTSLNATDRSSHKPEDAKAFFVPLQQIAARMQTAIVCVTHLNAAGKPLGRRIEGQGRVVIMLERPDPDGQPKRRKLYVRKSNTLYPPALGVTMGDAGNTYDTNPPTEPETVEAGPQRISALDRCLEWLLRELEGGPKMLGVIRKACDDAGFAPKTFYAAKARLKLSEFKSEGRTWIEVPS